MSSQHSYFGGMKPKIFAKREQIIVYQRGEDFSSHKREQKSSPFLRRIEPSRNLPHSLEEIFFARTRTKIFMIRSKKFSSHEREQKSSTFARKKLIGEENWRIRTLFECKDFSSCEEHSIGLLKLICMRYFCR